MAKREMLPLSGPRAVAAAAIDAGGHNLTQLSTALGRNAAYVQQWIKYGTPAVLPEKDRYLLASALGLPESSLREGTPPTAGVPARAARTHTLVQTAHGHSIPEPEFLGQRDLEVFSAVEGGPGEIVVSSDPIDVVRRPWFLEHVSKAFAVVVTGDSMEPVYEPGDIVLVNPRLPLIKGKDAIFTSERFGGDFKASIKRFVKSTPEVWVARQFTPPPGQTEEVVFDKAEWTEALRVVGKYMP